MWLLNITAGVMAEQLRGCQVLLGLLDRALEKRYFKTLRGRGSMRVHMTFVPNTNLWWWHDGSGARARAAS